MASSSVAVSKDGLLECVDRIRNCHMAYNCHFQSSAKTRDELQVYWKVATAHVELTFQCHIGNWFHQLWETHANDRSRHYHTAVHLLEMCTYLAEVFPSLTRSSNEFPRQENCTSLVLDEKDISTIILAVFFHDAVYDGKSSTNEEDSAYLFQKFAKEVELDEGTEHAVVAMIMASKSHKVDLEDCSSSCCLFLDLDMAVLGKQVDAYKNYASLIRKEYHFVPHSAYCEKRACVLQEFLKEKTIFSTPLFKQALELRARSNLVAEIESLRAGEILGISLRRENAVNLVT